MSFHANFYGGGGVQMSGGGYVLHSHSRGDGRWGPFSLLPPLFSFLTPLFSLLPNLVSFLPPLLFSFLPATFSFLPPPLSFLPPILSFLPPPLSLLSLNPVRPYIPVKKSVCANRPERNCFFFVLFFCLFVFVCVSFFFFLRTVPYPSEKMIPLWIKLLFQRENVISTLLTTRKQNLACFTYDPS